MMIEKFSMGVGDRFAHQGGAQLQAMIRARERGAEVVPVWNKSFREHSIVHSRPADVRSEADAAVRTLGWKHGYYVDADHIGLKNVDGFMQAADFFTLDVADFICKPGGHAAPADEEAVAQFVRKHRALIGRVRVPGIAAPVEADDARAAAIARKFLGAVREAGRIYRRVAEAKGAGAFVTEVSMDETDEPQTPVEMLFILAAIADEGIPAQTIAPKFTGRFNKGVDYVGDAQQFAREFNEDLAVIRFAVGAFGLPANLKLSVHSGSDKFSLYPVIAQALRREDAGLHLKTAGTTWLEELIGLAEAGGEGLAIAKRVYRGAFGRYDEMCGPYASVIDIDRARLPSPDEVEGWNSRQYVGALRHDPRCKTFNPNVRQLLHVGYKVAAEMGSVYTDALKQYADVIARHVIENVYDRHLKPLFL
jgi:hypothetical protein